MSNLKAVLDAIISDAKGDMLEAAARQVTLKDGKPVDEKDRRPLSKEQKDKFIESSVNDYRAELVAAAAADAKSAIK